MIETSELVLHYVYRHETVNDNDVIFIFVVVFDIIVIVVVIIIIIVVFVVVVVVVVVVGIVIPEFVEKVLHTWKVRRRRRVVVASSSPSILGRYDAIAMRCRRRHDGDTTRPRIDHYATTTTRPQRGDDDAMTT